MPNDDFLDLGRRDVLTTPDAQFLVPARDGEVASRIRLGEISRVIPPLAGCRRGLLGLVVIALHQIGPRTDQFALAANWNVFERIRIERCVPLSPGNGIPHEPLGRAPLSQFMVTMVDVR